MNLKKLVRNFFGFSRGETNGFLVLLPILLLILFSEPLYRYWVSSQKQDFTDESKYLDSLVATLDKQSPRLDSSEQQTAQNLFAFNPNETTKDELIELGFSGKLATRIINYRNKGGTFRIKNDLLKMYGMDSSLFDVVKPYMLLPDSVIKKQFASKNFIDETKKKVVIIRFDINTADTTHLKSIYGIGEKLSLRIIKYRESLGGFIRPDQLQEVFGLDTAVVNRLAAKSFIEENFHPKKLNLNTATEEELEKHPYLNRKEAKAIVSYRFQHGKFNSVEEVQKIYLLDKITSDKIAPYLTLD
jgi:competence protein ComEA